MFTQGVIARVEVHMADGPNGTAAHTETWSWASMGIWYTALFVKMYVYLIILLYGSSLWDHLLRKGAMSWTSREELLPQCSSVIVVVVQLSDSSSSAWWCRDMIVLKATRDV